MRHAVCLCVLVAAGMPLGCSPAPDGRGDAPAAPASPAPAAATSGGASADANDYRYVFSTKAAIVEVPLGAASCSEEIWSYVDEEPIEASRRGGLSRNGFRAGLARAETWPDLEDVLRRLAGRDTTYLVVTAAAGEPATLPVKRGASAATVFTIHGDGSASGADYPAGDCLLAMNCTVSQDPSRLVLTILPQIRSGLIETDVGMTPLGAGFRSNQELFSFDDLTMRLTMPAKDILVIGPSEDSLRQSSIGHCFLGGRNKGVPFETIIVIIPEVVRVPVR